MMREIFIGLLLALNGHSIEAKEIITWEAGVKEAGESNLEIKAAKNILMSSDFQEKATRSGFLPSVTAVAGVAYDSHSSPKTYSASINAKENLFSGFSDMAKIDRARFSKSISEINLMTVKAQVSFDLKSSFMGLVFSQKYISLTEDIIKRREANLRLVQLRFESGRENIGSVHLSKAYLAQAKYDHLQAINSLDVYQSKLSRVLGRDEYVDIEVEGEIPLINPQSENNRQLNYKALVRDLPDYKKSFFQEQSAQAALSLSRSTFYPSLDLTQSAVRSARESASASNTWSIGATLTFPLFEGGRDYYTLKSSHEDYRASVFTRKNIEESGVTHLKEAYTKYLEAVMKQVVDEAFVLAATSRERIAKAQYNNGLITFSDWDTIENDLINRQKSMLQTQKERVTAEATWEQVQGRGVIP